MNALLAMILAQSDGFREISLLVAGLLLIGITVVVMKLAEKARRAATEKELAAARAAAEALRKTRQRSSRREASWQGS